MKKLISASLVLFTIVCLYACQKTNDRNPAEFSFEVFENSAITVTTDSSGNQVFPIANIASGDNYVFKYTHIAEDIIDIADDEFSEEIIFEVSPSMIELFTFEADMLQTSANTYYSKFCFCPFVGDQAINEGKIKGRRTGDNTWEIELNISFNDSSQDQNINFTETFRL